MKHIRLGIVGLGRGFMLTLPALRAHPAVQLSAAHDLRDEALVRFESQFEATGHRTYEALLADSSVDALYIATPHELHAAQAIAALEAGKHVLVEKPMATSVGDCAAMARAAEKAGKVLMVGPSHAFDEPVRVAAELVASGRYGKVRLVNAFNYTDFMYRPRRPEELDSERGGGVVYSQAAHQIDVVRRIVRQPVESVRAVAANWDASRPSEGAYSALMTFASGAAATLTYSGYAHYDSDELLGWISELGRPKDPARYGEARKALNQLSQQDEIDAKLARTFGSASAGDPAGAPHHEHFGFVLVSCERADLKLLPTAIEVFGDERRETIPIAPPTLSRANVIEDFAASILGARPPVHDGWWGLETMACCAALLESSRIAADVKPQTIIQES
ncbi:Gfo/Idh/MocA family protein [Sphingobium subterraneum]|uniref:Gfo/Idh/MocA family protein n=1 Tax=Sphingobium subterraneum TaxID=627688 RepID=UPI0024846534|nr:Gfo/Idh/MocA family oxidoreductase [Sphingobium subterraneum]